MNFLNDTGFVVKRINLGEADRFVTIFTQNNGKIEVLAKGVRKITSRRSSHIELLNLVRFHSVRTRKNYILTETELINSFEMRKNDLKQFEIAFFVCELIDSLCPHGQVNGELFQLVGKFLNGGMRDDNSLMEFQAGILASLGYWNADRKFADERQARVYIESMIEKKIRSRVIGDF